jgi:hypothetical protein
MNTKWDPGWHLRGLEEQRLEAVKEWTKDLEFHTCQYNLIIHGLEVTTGQDCEDIVQSFFKKDPKILSALFLLQACHPLLSPQIPRVRFVRLRDRDLVLSLLIHLKVNSKRISVGTNLPERGARDQIGTGKKCYLKDHQWQKLTASSTDSPHMLRLLCALDPRCSSATWPPSWGPHRLGQAWSSWQLP